MQSASSIFDFGSSDFMSKLLTSVAWSVILTHEQIHLHCSVVVLSILQTRYYRLPTKLWEGNVFKPVCNSVHRGGGSPLWMETPSPRDPTGQRLPRLTSSGGHWSGRYVFYWIAYLLFLNLFKSNILIERELLLCGISNIYTSCWSVLSCLTKKKQISLKWVLIIKKTSFIIFHVGWSKFKVSLQRLKILIDKYFWSKLKRSHKWSVGGRSGYD